jgi:cell division protease FtsH
MARQMVTLYGMSSRLGLATFEQTPSPLLFPPAMQPKLAYSESTARAIDTEIEQLLDDAHARVRATLTEKRALLDALAQALLEKETLDRAAFDAVLQRQESGTIRQVSGAY